MSLLDNYVLAVDTANPQSGFISPKTINYPGQRSDTYMSQDNNIRSKNDYNFIPTINAQNETSQQYINNYFVNATYRGQISPTVVEQINLKGDNKWNNLSFNDIPDENYYASRTTTRETTNSSYAGNPEKEDIGITTWTYEDKPKVTVNETTMYSYSGNAEKEDIGSTTWTYEDKPKVTVNETTLYSYAGDVAPVTNYNQMNRVQFTGLPVIDNKENFSNSEQNNQYGISHVSNKNAYAGVQKWGKQSTTLIENYTPGPNGATNVQANPIDKIGNSLFKNDWDIVHSNGSGSIQQAIPNATHFQQMTKELQGTVLYPANKSVDIDSRQTAEYLVTNLTNNPYSIYEDTTKKSYIPTYFANTNASDYNPIRKENMEYASLEKQKLPPNFENVYINNNYNFNEVKLRNTYGQLNSNIENPFLFQQDKIGQNITYPGKSASGSTINSGNEYVPYIYLDGNSIESSRYININ